MKIVLQGGDVGDDVIDLHESITSELGAGTARVELGEPSDLALGPVFDTLFADLGSGGGAVGAIAAVLVTWTRSRRRGRLQATITRPDGATMTIKTDNLVDLGDEAVTRIIGEMRQFLTDAPPA